MPRRAHLAALVVCAISVTAGADRVFAQDEAGGLLPPGWVVGRVRIETHRPSHPTRMPERRTRVSRSQFAHERSLTVMRRFAPPPLTDGGFFESGTPYDNVRAFDPDPKVDSGVQFPYGLDGVGGYGSDLGFGAGHDAAVYDRGM